MIKIQKEDFNIDKEISYIKSKYLDVGAISSFTGYVRNLNQEQNVKFINLEVYEDMAYKTLENICLEVKKRWNLLDILIIHRFGKLKVGEKIVLVSTFSFHRKQSFEACNFIMDYLKKEAPFWKKEYYDIDSKWLENSILKN